MITGKELALLFHKKCMEEGPKHDPPTHVLAWDELEEHQRALKIKIASGVLVDLNRRDTEEIKVGD